MDVALGCHWPLGLPTMVKRRAPQRIIGPSIVALTSEHDINALRAIFSKTLEGIQGIINTGWILIREEWCRARFMLGGDSPWLRKVLGILSYFRIGSMYTYAVWCDLKEKWEDRKWRRSPKSDNNKPYKKGLDCTNARMCE